MFIVSLIAAAAAMTPGVLSVEYVQPFSLEEPITYHWRQDAPAMTDGTILVVRVDSTVARPKQAEGPTLFVGNTPAAVTHPGYLDGHMVVFVPGHPKLDLTPVFWAQSGLPERTTVADGLAFASQYSADDQAVSPAQPPLALRNERSLYGVIADLILRYAPSDTEFAQGYKLSADQ